MERTFTARVWQEDEWYVAQCLEVEVASQGETEREQGSLIVPENGCG
jgi:hypothetical protein